MRLSENVTSTRWGRRCSMARRVMSCRKVDYVSNHKAFCWAGCQVTRAFTFLPRIKHPNNPRRSSAMATPQQAQGMTTHTFHLGGGVAPREVREQVVALRHELARPLDAVHVRRPGQLRRQAAVHAEDVACHQRRGGQAVEDLRMWASGFRVRLLWLAVAAPVHGMALRGGSGLIPQLLSASGRAWYGLIQARSKCDASNAAWHSRAGLRPAAWTTAREGVGRFMPSMRQAGDMCLGCTTATRVRRATHVADALPRLLAGLDHALREEAVQHGHRRRLVVAAQQEHAAARFVG